ncbi:hypothetical protein UFOVP71_434 [uncultured Caudovirales phage]|uniref:Uncharacterized protein n=1 Tax=uncultured Caudovirales phage TaxID=2100421 RepID=A0A6J5TAE3_9CAUD|nr:hypothetical protein UFOVP71_434 [uncultured Caudovirales phage]
MEQVQDTQAEGQEAAAQAPVSLTLQDLKILAGSVELGAQRGAFRAGELEVIGATYNKLATFLAANAPVETPADDSTEVTETAE